MSYPLPGRQGPFPDYPRQNPTIRDPRYPTVAQWLENERKTNLKHRQPTGFALPDGRVVPLSPLGQPNIAEANK